MKECLEEFQDKTNRENAYVEEILCCLRQRYKFKIVEWKPMKEEYPIYMFLSGDKGILAYLNFYMFEQKDEIYYHDYFELIHKLMLAYSDLDRPVFNLYYVIGRGKDDILNKPSAWKEGSVYFETYEQIKDKIFREIDNAEFNETGLYKSIREEMGDLNELIEIFCDLKKNNVKIS